MTDKISFLEIRNDKPDLKMETDEIIWTSQSSEISAVDDALECSFSINGLIKRDRIG